MILGVAFCPHPPLLVPSVAGSAAAEITDLLAACDQAVAAVTASAERIVVLGSAAAGREFSPLTPSSLRGYGPPEEDPTQLPLSLVIGRWLLARARPDIRDTRLIAVADDAGADPPGPPEREATAVIVMGDGSARRGLKAPGYLDPRAAPFDNAVRRALSLADSAALSALDPALGAELLAAGVPAWRAAGRLVGGRAGADRWHGRICYDADPFGVQYFVATWLPLS